MAPMDSTVPSDIVLKTLRRMLAALNGMGHEPALIGALAHNAWGCASPIREVQLLTPSTEAQRPGILGAARGEGFKQSDGAAPVSASSFRLSYPDAKLAATGELAVFEAVTPYLKQVIGRAKKRPVFGVEVTLASVEDLILMRAGSADAADQEDVIGLLRAGAGGLDAAYLKKEAEAAGVFDAVKRAWQEAKKRG